MIVFAVDPGYGRCGIAVLKKENRQETLLYSGFFETSNSLSLNERLFLVGQHIRSIITQFQPEYLSIEGLFFAKNAKTAMEVSQVRGVIIYESLCHNLIIQEYTPNQVKTAVAGYGSASKNDVYRMVEKLIQLSPAKKYIDDEIDAIAVGITFLASYRLYNK